MSYRNKLNKSLTDSNHVAIEFLLIWIGLMLTGLVVLVTLGLLFG